MRFFIALWASIFITGCAAAETKNSSDNDIEAFVEANILGIFFHELGHALIDIEGIPIFGQEEDAADALSIFLIDAFYEEEAAQDLAYDAALGFWAEAEARDQNGDGIAWWDNHGPDEQRFYNTICIFYGADPERREQFARDLNLPEERAESCVEEFDQINKSWGELIEDLTKRQSGSKLTLRASESSLSAETLQPEIDALNQEMSLSTALTVNVAPCGEANAFYDPEERAITMCLEFEDHLRALAKNL